MRTCLALLGKMATDLTAQKDYLCELDGAMGDGDQGVTMAIGFGAIAAALPALADQDIGTIVTTSGLAFNNAAASTIGALFATACLRAGKAVQGKTALDLADLATMAAAACTGIQARGKAQVGDKTVLDALAPTVAALQTAAAQGTPLPSGPRPGARRRPGRPRGHHPAQGAGGPRRLARRALGGPSGPRGHRVHPDAEVGGGVSGGSVRWNCLRRRRGGCLGLAKAQTFHRKDRKVSQDLQIGPPG